MYYDIANVEKMIKQLKVELSQTAKETGLNSASTIYCSQKLDQLIIIYQKQRRKKKNVAITA